MTVIQREDDWRSAWLDLAAFLSVLGLAWWTRARAADLVWSLWLSSLVVGYTIIIWGLFRPVLEMGAEVRRSREHAGRGRPDPVPGVLYLVVLIPFLGGVFGLAFFTVHFVGFHYVHAGLVNFFLPLRGDHDGSRTLEGVALFREALRRYWPYLPAAFLSHRAAFSWRAPTREVLPFDVTPKAIAARKAASAAGSVMMLPYQNVVRMHVLIFFFAFAHFAELDNFAVYAVVYAVYFFPWRLVSATKAAQATPA
jgi:hypothetical protein